MKSLPNEVSTVPIEYTEEVGGAQAPSIDFFAILVAVLRRWKLVIAIALAALIATNGVLRFVPRVYRSTVEILVYDPEQQIDAAVQKPISPFVDAVGNELMNTEIKILRSKSVALRVASELGLDKDPEFQSRNPIGDVVERSATESRIWRNGSVSAHSFEPLITVEKSLAVRRLKQRSWTGQQMS